MIIGIHHTAIATQNMKEMTEYYRDVLGFEEITRGSWPQGTDFADKVVDLKNTSADWVMLRAANSQIELFQYHTPRHAPGDPNRPVNKPGYTHICLEVTGLQELYERLAARGIRFHSEPLDHGDMGCFANYSRDPDGNVIEFVEYEPGNVESLQTFVAGLDGSETDK